MVEMEDNLTYHDECPGSAGSLRPGLMIPMTTSPATLTSQNASKPLIMTISGIGWLLFNCQTESGPSYIKCLNVIKSQFGILFI